MNDDELNSLSKSDIELILADQGEYYNEKEISQLKDRLRKAAAEELEEIQAQKLENRPKEIVCPKCDCINNSENTKCEFCSYEFKDADYIVKDEDTECEPDLKESHGGLYFIAVLLPLVGVILGIICFGKDKEDLGKSLILFSIIIGIIEAVIVYFILT